MGRWQPDARGRLEQAALDLFAEQGFEATTVPQITARAGLTTRTFFRYFADKREVLFAGEDSVPAQVAQLLADAPPSLGAMDLIADRLGGAAEAVFEGRSVDYLQRRRAVVDAEPALYERELRKFALLSQALDQGFRERGVDELTARLTAEIAVTAFRIGAGRWIAQGGASSLPDTIDDTLAAMRNLTNGLATDKGTAPVRAGSDLGAGGPGDIKTKESR